MLQHTTHKSIVRDFYRRALGQGDVAFAEQIIADDYIQHSRTAKPGKAGLLDALRSFSLMPKPANPTKPFLRLIAEGDYVATNMSFIWAGKRKAVIDIFRFRNGQVAEHWDVIQDEPDYTRNGHALMDGPPEVSHMESTATHKQIVTEFYQRVYMTGETAILPQFVAPDLIAHHPEMDNGLDGLRAYLREQHGKLVITRVLHTLAEGNFVVVHAEGHLSGQAGVFCEVFRLEAGKIAEHWSLQQMLPLA